jgi:hypothetical protein
MDLAPHQNRWIVMSLVPSALRLKPLPFSSPAAEWMLLMYL